MIKITNLTKEFSGQKVLDGLDVDIQKEKFWLLSVLQVQENQRSCVV